MDYQRTIDHLIEWAASDSNVRAVVLTGSAAEGTAHPLSDRDLELHVRDAAPLTRDDSWWSELGEVLAVERLENAEGHTTRLVYYVGGKLDFTLIPVGASSGQYDRPFSVLLDKDGVTEGFALIAAAITAPTQEAFDECCNWAAAAAIMAAKAIVRDEPWSEMIRWRDFSDELLRMIEWEHSARDDGARDVRFLGSRMRTWMDPELQRTLVENAPRFGQDNAHSLIALLTLFTQLASRVAAAAGLQAFALDHVRAEVLRILGRRTLQH
ncbi:aminoglycoside 6-adenylyltransferase [Humidisolicoccus flavus]|uniref:aminoglycoside 6-adenylyltransferase n=1 Tax=Humidisolicoccus flavus TaxID=3111414 RepID=UPI0032487A9B